MLPDYFFPFVALYAFGAGIPARDDSLWTELKDCVVEDRIDQELGKGPIPLLWRFLASHSNPVSCVKTPHDARLLWKESRELCVSNNAGKSKRLFASTPARASPWLTRAADAVRASAKGRAPGGV